MDNNLNEGLQLLDTGYVGQELLLTSFLRDYLRSTSDIKVLQAYTDPRVLCFVVIICDKLEERFSVTTADELSKTERFYFEMLVTIERRCLCALNASKSSIKLQLYIHQREAFSDHHVSNELHVADFADLNEVTISEDIADSKECSEDTQENASFDVKFTDPAWYSLLYDRFEVEELPENIFECDDLNDSNKSPESLPLQEGPAPLPSNALIEKQEFSDKKLEIYQLPIHEPFSILRIVARNRKLAAKTNSICNKKHYALNPDKIYNPDEFLNYPKHKGCLEKILKKWEEKEKNKLPLNLKYGNKLFHCEKYPYYRWELPIFESSWNNWKRMALLRKKIDSDTVPEPSEMDNESRMESLYRSAFKFMFPCPSLPKLVKDFLDENVSPKYTKQDYMTIAFPVLTPEEIVGDGNKLVEIMNIRHLYTKICDGELPLDGAAIKRLYDEAVQQYCVSTKTGPMKSNKLQQEQTSINAIMGEDICIFSDPPILPPNKDVLDREMLPTVPKENRVRFDFNSSFETLKNYLQWVDSKSKGRTNVASGGSKIKEGSECRGESETMEELLAKERRKNRQTRRTSQKANSRDDFYRLKLKAAIMKKELLGSQEADCKLKQEASMVKTADSNTLKIVEGQNKDSSSIDIGISKQNYGKGTDVKNPNRQNQIDNVPGTSACNRQGDVPAETPSASCSKQNKKKKKRNKKVKSKQNHGSPKTQSSQEVSNPKLSEESSDEPGEQNLIPHQIDTSPISHRSLTKCLKNESLNDTQTKKSVCKISRPSNPRSKGNNVPDEETINKIRLLVQQNVSRPFTSSSSD